MRVTCGGVLLEPGAGAEEAVIVRSRYKERLKRKQLQQTLRDNTLQEVAEAMVAGGPGKSFFYFLLYFLCSVRTLWFLTVLKYVLRLSKELLKNQIA